MPPSLLFALQFQTWESIAHGTRAGTILKRNTTIFFRPSRSPPASAWKATTGRSGAPPTATCSGAASGTSPTSAPSSPPRRRWPTTRRGLAEPNWSLARRDAFLAARAGDGHPAGATKSDFLLVPVPLFAYTMHSFHADQISFLVCQPARRSESGDEKVRMPDLRLCL